MHPQYFGNLVDGENHLEFGLARPAPFHQPTASDRDQIGNLACRNSPHLERRKRHLRSRSAIRTDGLIASLIKSSLPVNWRASYQRLFWFMVWGCETQQPAPLKNANMTIRKPWRPLVGSATTHKTRDAKSIASHPVRSIGSSHGEVRHAAPT